ncbi:hypothetical protein V2J09_014047 [Rumex salicifolius]
MVIARGKMEGTLYSTGGSSDCIVVVRENGDADLWHCRLGHMSEKGMKVLCSKDLLPGLKSAKIGLCEDYIFEKQKRNFEEAEAGVSSQQSMGLAFVKSLSGASYYMTLIDDFTGKIWVYFLKQKSDAFDSFRKWKVLVENETSLKIKCFRSDN